MSRLSNKGQSLAIFIIFVPIFIMMGAFIVDLGMAKYSANKLNLINKMVVKYGVLNIDKNPKEEMINLIYKNDSKIDSYDINIDNNENTVTVTIKKATRGFFGSVLDKDIYKEKSSYKGYIKDEKIIIERVL